MSRTMKSSHFAFSKISYWSNENDVGPAGIESSIGFKVS